MTDLSDAAWEGFDEVAATDVEVGSAAPQAEPAPANETAKVSEPEIEENDVAEEGDEGDEGDDGGEAEKPKKTAKDHQIDRLKREKAEAKRKASEYEQRLAALEARLTPPEKEDIAQSDDGPPNPQDAEKYRLGTLDPRYIEDLATYKVEQTLKASAAADLQRQQEEQGQQALLTTLDSLTTKGTQLDPDFREKVVESGFRGEWDLSQATFEAAGEAEHGARILYDLSQDPAEATRVAQLSPFAQLQFVAKRDAEIAQAAKARTAPQAGEPPKHNTRGANSRIKDNPATDDLDDFARQFDAK